MITEEFKGKLTSAMNRGGWGKENIKEVLPLIEDYIKQLPLHNVSQQRELLLQAYKEGFQAATDSIIGANEAVKSKTLQ